MFDVTMGSYDGAKVCELVGLFILHQLSAYPNGSIGLHRDDGQAAFKNVSARIMDKTRKNFSKIFGELSLKITALKNRKLMLLKISKLKNRELSGHNIKPYHRQILSIQKTRQQPAIY